jgi:acetolactate synthase-1/2/3 large subunit
MRGKLSMSEKMNAGDHIVRNLIANGVDTVFGLPGVQTYPIFDALARNANKIRTVSARHEQATAYMALGYAKSTGRPSVYSVVPDRAS